MTAVDDTPDVAHIAGPIADRMKAFRDRHADRLACGDDGPVGDEIEIARSQGISAWRADRWSRVVPQRFQFAALCDLTGEPARQVSEWAEVRPRVNLVLFGPVGTGKTHAAIAACRPAHDSGLEVMFLPVVDLLDLLRPGGPDSSLDDMADVDRLIVDDLGSERPTDWTGERLYAVVNRRWMNEAPTVYTTNLAPKDLRDLLGDRMYSRIVGSGACVVNMAGPDRRRG